MEKLPQELKIQIFVRLPVKSLALLKCVSKKLFSFISNPNFAQLHFQRSSSKYTQRFLYATPSQIRSIDITNHASFRYDSASVKLHFPLHHQPHVPYFRILGSCRGLLLLELTKQQLFLWNPSTSFCKQIQHPRLSWKFVVPGSFCYVESTNDYFLMLANCSFGDITGFEVSSLRTNSCEKLPLKYHDRHHRLPSCSVLNGVFHLLVSHPVKIIAFNITTKNLRQLSMPSLFNNIYSLERCKLGVLEGCLTLMDSTAIDEVKVWVMREEHGEESSSSWTK